MKKRTCDYCHRDILPGETPFELKLEIYAAAELPEITQEDMEKDHTAEIEAIINAMEQMNVDELADEVFESYIFLLCCKCRKEIHNRLKLHLDKKQPI